MADYQSTGECQASLNPIIKINERSDKEGVGEVDGRGLLRMYIEHA